MAQYEQTFALEWDRFETDLEKLGQYTGDAINE